MRHTTRPQVKRSKSGHPPACFLPARPRPSDSMASSGATSDLVTRGMKSERLLPKSHRQTPTRAGFNVEIPSQRDLGHTAYELSAAIVLMTASGRRPLLVR